LVQWLLVGPGQRAVRRPDVRVAFFVWKVNCLRDDAKVESWLEDWMRGISREQRMAWAVSITQRHAALRTDPLAPTLARSF
jgi:hypothetical protein